MAVFQGSPSYTRSIMNVVHHPPPERPKRDLSVHSELNNVKVPSVYQVYPPALKTHAPIPSRLNPLRPNPPERLTCVTETVDPNFQNEQRRVAFERQNFHRFHNAWSRYYYGNNTEKELYNRFLREGLKEQMQDREIRRSQSFKERVKESDFAVQKDRSDIERDAEQVKTKHSFLTQYRDANKQMMEEKERRMRESRQLQTSVDREQLKYNPINWSCSLK